MINLFSLKVHKGTIKPTEQEDLDSYNFFQSVFSECPENYWAGESGKSTGQFGLTLHENTVLNWLFEPLTEEVKKYWNTLNYADLDVRIRDSWANYHTRKDTTAEHSHNDGYYGNSHISGVFYFRKPFHDGHIHLCDPLDYIKRLTPYKSMQGIDTISEQVPCEQYEFILFPSWVRHRVPTYSSDKERIAISFNYIGHEVQ